MLDLALNNLDIRDIYIHLETGNILLHFTDVYKRQGLYMAVGILALQGAFAEHGQMLDRLGVEHFEIRQLR